MNPCIDCRILMLREAREFMEMVGADFLVTGEVLGQRPMSQRRDTLNIIDREAGVKGYVVRPLSAGLLAETVPEKQGLVDRGRLYTFSGRSRKPQMALAEEFGLTDYPAPAGGCLLTEPNYAHRLRELFSHQPNPSLKDLNLLRLGRHFRFSPTSKAVIGRNKEENDVIESYAGSDDYLFRIEGVGSPTVLLSGDDSHNFIEDTASLCVCYSDAKDRPHVEVTVRKSGDSFTVPVSGTRKDLLIKYRIEKPEKNLLKNSMKQPMGTHHP
jgi:tRNA U34 2-thiouridine synthase MnmA/TrmU